MMRRIASIVVAVVMATSLPAQDKPAEKPAEKAAEKPAESSGGSKKEPEKKPPTWVAIVGGEVWTASGPNIPGGTVLLKDDKIYQVGVGVRIPEGATVIDATGKHVAPGLVAIASRGALGFRTGASREKAKDRFNPFSEFMLMSLGSGITTAHEGPGGRDEMFGSLVPGGGGAFAGTPRGQIGGVIAKLTFGTIEGFELRDPSGVFLQYPGGRSSQMLELRDALQKAKEHAGKRRDWLKALAEGKKDEKEPKTDETVMAIARGLEGELPLFIGADEREDLDGCLALADEFKAPFVIHGAMEAWTIPDRIGRRPVSLILCPRGVGGRGTRPYKDRFLDAPHGWSLENAAYATRAGIPWATMTLSTNIQTTLFCGRDLLGLAQEAAFAVRGGAPEIEALRSVTLTPAQILKVDDRIGSLDPGKDADVVIYDRAPLDYRAFADLVWVNGRLVYERAKVPFWNHVPTDRSKPPTNWKPFGIWEELEDPTAPAAAGGAGH